MTKNKSFFKQHSVLIYFILTIVLTWGCMALAAYPGGFPLTDEQLETAGVLVYVAMLVGPSAAGLLLIGLLDGRAGFRELLSRLTRWRVGARWYAVALLTAPLLIITILSALSLISSDYQPVLFTAENKPALVLSAIVAGLVVGLFEEIGWTGFAIPRLNRRYGVLLTGLIVGVVWGAWHFPPFWNNDTFSASLPFILLLGQLFSWLPPYRVLMVWVYNRTESLLVCILMHASLMASLNALVPAEITGKTLLTWILTWAAVLWAIVAAGAVIKDRRLSAQQTQEQVA